MSTLSRAISTLTLLALLCISTNAVAGVHVVRFGGEHGAVYTPNNLFLITNDVIRFEGDFEKYPLMFVEVPEGAEMPPPIVSGTEYSYRIRAGGHYTILCSTAGFYGAFTAIDERIGVSQIHDPFGLSVYPNPASHELRLRGVEPRDVLSATIGAVDGSRHNLAIDVSDGEARFDLRSVDLHDGMYMLEVVTHEKVYARKVMIVR